MKLDFLQPVTAAPGPWASVYAGTGPPDEAALTRRELSWDAVCRSLEEQGADEATVAAVRGGLDDLAPDAAPRGLALFATGGRIALTRRLDRAPEGTEVTWSELPRLSPLLEFGAEDPACLVALVDRTGADLHLHGAAGGEEAGTVEGRDWPVHRAAGGDWSAAHFEAAVENTWEENAAKTAEEIARVFPDSGADLVLLAGEPRMCHSVRDHLPENLRRVTTVSSHGRRAAGADTAQLTADIEAARMEYTARHTEEVLDRFRAGRARSGGATVAVEGVRAVADAAREHRIDTLLIDPTAQEAHREVWVGEEPDQVALRRADVELPTTDEPHPHAHAGRADDALLLSAAVTGGEAIAVPGDGVPSGGIGALLRWPMSEEEKTAH